MKELFVTCPEKLEPLLIKELEELGIQKIRPGFRGVFTPASMQAIYTINYASRLATRVLYPLHSFVCHDRESLYAAARQIPWFHFLTPEKTFAIDANVSHPRITHSLFAAQVVKDAICDQLKEKTGQRPSIDLKYPDVQLNLFIHNQNGVLSFDTSTAPLFKRGWRSSSTATSIQENLAAALLIQAGYKAGTILCDPFCGSGTFLIEAALIASQTPPGFFRSSWGFTHMPQFNEAQWEAVKASFDAKRVPLSPGTLFGADKDILAIQAARSHARKIGCLHAIDLRQSDIIRYTPSSPIQLLITDPPYGKRLETSTRIYQELAEFIKKTNPETSIILAPNAEYLKATPLTIKRSFPFYHGGLDVTAFTCLKN